MKMDFLKIVLLALFVFLSACRDNTSNSNNTTIAPPSALIGTWETQACEKSRIVTDNIWYKGVIEFTKSGTVLLGSKKFTDANCITLSKNTRPTQSDFPLNYTETGSQLLQEGIMGNGLTISIIEGFYTINNNS